MAVHFLLFREPCNLPPRATVRQCWAASLSSERRLLVAELLLEPQRWVLAAAGGSRRPSPAFQRVRVPRSPVGQGPA